MKTICFFVPALAGLIIFSGCNKKDTAYNSSPEPTSSQYYVLDIGVKIPRPGFTILPLNAYQQTTEYTCGPAAALTLLHYYGRSGDEMTIAKEMGTSTTTGTNPEQMVNWLQKNSFKVSSGEGGSLELIRSNLEKKIPTLIEWSDWGGHWVLAVGYDTRNTENPMDDVIVFADPYDRHDDRNDGIDWFNAQRFYYMWYDALLFGKVMKRIYITATPLTL
ncbi:MAG: C39 family peptidase [Bacteroidetes bacterium]|nr:C39 family peptidase [Bacteroidota bacterium]